MVWLLIATTTTLLALQVRIALKLSPVARILIAAQACFWLITFVARPLTLLIYQPKGTQQDPIADPRLWVDGYSQSLVPILIITIVGLSFYLVGLMLWSRRALFESHSLRESSHEPFLLIWVTGWVFRALEIGGLDSGLAHTLSLLATIGASGVLVYSSSPRWRGPRAAVLLVASGEVAWAVLVGSKTPIVATGLALILHSTIQGWDGRATRRLVIMAGIFLMGFSSFQAFKLGERATQSFEQSISQSYSPSLRPLLELERRFDQMTAVADAAALRDRGTWMTPAQTLERVWDAALPNTLIGEKESAGRLWNIEVRARSLPYVAESDVSLAEGFIAEGFAIGGWRGVAVEAILLLLAVSLTARAMMTKKGVWLYWGLLMFSSPLLMERGALGIIEATSKNLQAAVFAAFLAFLHTRSGARKPAARVAYPEPASTAHGRAPR